MAWLKIDDGITEHPKFIGLTPQAWTLWLHGTTYCARNLTDGHIPKGMLPRLSALPVSAAKKAAGELVSAGLWDDHGDTWHVHDYLDYQRSRKQVDADRAAAAERQRKARESKAAARAKSQRDEPYEPAPVTEMSQRDIGVSHTVSHGNVTAQDTDTDTDTDTTSPSRGFTPRGANPLEGDRDVSELRAQRIARILGDTTETTLVEIRHQLHEFGAMHGDETIADLAAARCWHLREAR